MKKKNMKKLTQLQIKEMVHDQKTQFIADVYVIVLQNISRAVTHSKQDIIILGTQNKAVRNISISVHDRQLAVLIHRGGNVELQFNVSGHDKYSEQIFYYSSRLENQKQFIGAFDELLEWLIPVFVEGVETDSHSLKNYVIKAMDQIEDYDKALTSWLSAVHLCEEASDETGNQ